MKTRILLFLLVLISLSSFAQEWDHLYDNTFGSIRMIQSTHHSYDSGFCIYHFNSNDYFRYSKTDIDGNILWTRIMRYSESNYFGRGWMTTDKYGNTYYSGFVDVNEAGKTAIMKINSCGELIWCHTIDIPYNPFNYGMSIHVLPNNDILVHTRYAGLWSKSHPEEREQLMKFNENGELLWINHIMPSYEHPDKENLFLETCIPSADGGAFLAGTVYMQDSVSGTDLMWPKGVIVKTDDFGEEEYISIFDYPEENSSMVFEFALETDSDILLAGYDYIAPSNATPTPTICSIDKISGQLKTRSIQYLADDIPNGMSLMVREVENGYMIVNPIGIASTTKNMLQIEILDESFSGVDSILFENRVIIYDNSTTACVDNSIIVSGLEWEDPFNSGNSKAMAMKIRQDLTMDSITNIQLTYDSLCPYTIETGERDCDCYTAFYVGVENDKILYNDDLEGVKTFPNPASKFLTFETKTISRNRKIQIFNLQGAFISEASFPQRSTKLGINTSTMSAGTYIARLLIEGRETGSTKFIIQ